MSCMRGDQQGSIGGVATLHFERHDFVGLRGLDDLCNHGPCLPLQTERQTPVSPKVLRAAATAAEEQDVIAPLANGGAMGGGNLKVAVADRGRSMSMPVKKVSIGSRKGERHGESTHRLCLCTQSCATALAPARIDRSADQHDNPKLVGVGICSVCLSPAPISPPHSLCAHALLETACRNPAADGSRRKWTSVPSATRRYVFAAPRVG